MLILAGVSLNATIGENGIVTRAQEAKEMSKASSEKEALQLSIAGNQYSGENSSRIGEKLLDKKIGNDNWKVVLTDDEVYGTNWHFAEKGTEIPGFGVLEKSWLINYETGEVIELEHETYTKISSTDAMAIDDHIIFNLDSSVIDGNVPNTKEGLEKSLGENVELKGFNYDENSGLTNTSFRFDGIDDYIEMKFNKDKYKFEDGLTLEFYGKLKGKGHLFDEITGSEVINSGGLTLGGFFEIRNSDVNKGKIGGEFIFDDLNGYMQKICFNLGAGLNNDFSHPCYGNSDGWFRMKDFKQLGYDMSYDRDIYFTVTVNGDKKEVVGFIDGVEFQRESVDDGRLRWEDFVQGSLERM